jgi:predicted DNA-binding transcriptional regulator YafY
VPEERTVRILYTNYRGETTLRRIVPERVHFASTDWHPKPQWLLDALDVERNAMRSFAMKDIRSWIANE